MVDGHVGTRLLRIKLLLTKGNSMKIKTIQSLYIWLTTLHYIGGEKSSSGVVWSLTDSSFSFVIGMSR